MPFFRRKAVEKSPQLSRTTSISSSTASVASWELWNGDTEGDSPLHTSSRLSKTLQEVLHDKEALPYLIQYMEHKKVAYLIRLWLDVESFQAATFTRMQSHALKKSANRTDEVLVDDVNYKAPQFISNTESLQQGCAVESVSDGKLPNNNILYCDTSANHVASNYSSPSNGLAGKEPRSSSHSSCYPTTTNISHKSDLSSSSSQPPISSLSSSSTLCTNSSSSTITTVPADRCVAGHSAPADGDRSQARDEVSADHTSAAPTPESTVKSDNSDLLVEEDITQHQGDVVPSSVTDEKLKEKLLKSIAQDAVNIYQTYISQDAKYSIGVTDEIRNRTISKICREDGQVDPYCFQECQHFVVDRINKEHFSDFLQSEFHCKHQVDILTGSQVFLADILYNELALSYFMEYMEQEESLELLQCFLDLDNFQQHLSSLQGTYDGMEAQADAMVIYDKYFSLQASKPLGFADSTRFDVESAICREEGPLPDCFAKPKLIVLKTIDKSYFPSFMKSEMFYKYLSDLITTVQVATDIPSYVRTRKNSDSLSEHSGHSNSESVSTKNTLLAMASNNKKVFKINDSDMRIDEKLFNPDSLWKREQAGNMTLGRVDDFGLFVSSFAPEPDHEKKKKGFFKIKKDDEKQEEMAAQIARMIIEDVNNATSQADIDVDDVL